MRYDNGSKFNPLVQAPQEKREVSGVFRHNRNGDALAWVRQQIERDIEVEAQHGKVRIIMANGQKGPDA